MYLSHVNSAVSASTTGVTTGSFVSTASGSRSSIVNEATLEAGGGGGGWLSEEGRAVAGAVGGAAAWPSSSEKELTSVPTSPTYSPPPEQVCLRLRLNSLGGQLTFSSFQGTPTTQPPLIMDAREKKKQRYLKDRVNSLTGSEIKVAVAESVSAAAAENADDEDDPYAWIAQTAPASPELERPHHRSRNETGDHVVASPEQTQGSQRRI